MTTAKHMARVLEYCTTPEPLSIIEVLLKKSVEDAKAKKAARLAVKEARDDLACSQRWVERNQKKLWAAVMALEALERSQWKK